MEFTSRYEALGVPLPDPATMCQGQCESIGFYPQHRDDMSMTPAERAAWDAAEAAEHAEDGWHFIRCAECNGTGKRAAPRAPQEPQPEARARRDGGA